MKYTLLTKHYFVLIICYLVFSHGHIKAQLLWGMTSGGVPFYDANNNLVGSIFNVSVNGSNFNTLKPFLQTLDGNNPFGNLTEGNDGFLYGMCTSTYTNANYGTIFRISTTGSFTILRTLDGSKDGANPRGSLILGNDGFFYGMCSAGGRYGYGTIFKITKTGVFTKLKDFNQTASFDGRFPEGSLVQGNDGNLYGMCNSGGLNGVGTIFKISTSGVFTKIKDLNASNDGSYPVGELIQASDNNLYGMCPNGGLNRYGTIFKISTTGSFTKIKDFDINTDCGSPPGSLIEAPDGNFYGYGGTWNAAYIFKCTKSGVVTRFYEIKSSIEADGIRKNLILGSDGNLYGMSASGGANAQGNIFKISLSGSFTKIWDFSRDSDGSNPFGSLVQGNDGNLYGMCHYGGANNFGTIFKISKSGNFTKLRDFKNSPDGNFPYGSLVQGINGNVYGMCRTGGQYGYGTIFTLNLNGNFSKLWDFRGNIDGANPQGNLTPDSSGNLYGMCQNGGANNFGTIFVLSTTGSFTKLKDFDGINDGKYPNASLVFGRDNNLYGMCYLGGANNAGTIFRISKSGVFSKLKDFNHSTDGNLPTGSLVIANDGNFYGTCSNGGYFASGTVFKITSSGLFTKIRDIDWKTDGSFPVGSLMLAKDGLLYGFCKDMASAISGSIFKITTNGILTKIKKLNGNTDGYNLFGNLVQDSDSNLYGMCENGGTYAGGTLFKLTTNGSFVKLMDFNSSTGLGPKGSLIILKDSDFNNPITSNDLTKEITEKEGVRIIYNNGFLNVLNTNCTTDFLIIDNQGRIILKDKFHNCQYELKLNKGVYIIQISDADGVVKKKILVE